MNIKILFTQVQKSKLFGERKCKCMFFTEIVDLITGLDRCGYTADRTSLSGRALVITH